MKCDLSDMSKFKMADRSMHSSMKLGKARHTRTEEIRLEPLRAGV
ncbi:MAG: hypothetical protein JMDDDDMK_02579 [Acidobacteria bacterium]|nr:hypothetical protein [Acidobacteriota bacterium]